MSNSFNEDKFLEEKQANAIVIDKKMEKPFIDVKAINSNKDDDFPISYKGGKKAISLSKRKGIFQKKVVNNVKILKNNTIQSPVYSTVGGVDSGVVGFRRNVERNHKTKIYNDRDATTIVSKAESNNIIGGVYKPKKIETYEELIKIIKDCIDIINKQVGYLSKPLTEQDFGVQDTEDTSDTKVIPIAHVIVTDVEDDYVVLNCTWYKESGYGPYSNSLLPTYPKYPEIHSTIIDISKGIMISRGIKMPYESVVTPAQEFRGQGETLIKEYSVVNEFQSILKLKVTKESGVVEEEVLDTYELDAYFGLQGIVISIWKVEGQIVIANIKKINPGETLFFENVTETVLECIKKYEKENEIFIFHPECYTSPFVYSFFLESNKTNNGSLYFSNDEDDIKLIHVFTQAFFTPSLNEKFYIDCPYYVKMGTFCESYDENNSYYMAGKLSMQNYYRIEDPETIDLVMSYILFGPYYNSDETFNSITTNYKSRKIDESVGEYVILNVISLETGIRTITRQIKLMSKSYRLRNKMSSGQINMGNRLSILISNYINNRDGFNINDLQKFIIMPRDLSTSFYKQYKELPNNRNINSSNIYYLYCMMYKENYDIMVSRDITSSINFPSDTSLNFDLNLDDYLEGRKSIRELDIYRIKASIVFANYCSSFSYERLKEALALLYEYKNKMDVICNFILYLIRSKKLKETTEYIYTPNKPVTGENEEQTIDRKKAKDLIKSVVTKISNDDNIIISNLEDIELMIYKNSLHKVYTLYAYIETYKLSQYVTN